MEPGLPSRCHLHPRLLLLPRVAHKLSVVHFEGEAGMAGPHVSLHLSVVVSHGAAARQAIDHRGADEVVGVALD